MSILTGKGMILVWIFNVFKLICLAFHINNIFNLLNPLNHCHWLKKNINLLYISRTSRINQVNQSKMLFWDFWDALGAGTTNCEVPVERLNKYINWSIRTACGFLRLYDPWTKYKNTPPKTQPQKIRSV